MQSKRLGREQKTEQQITQKHIRVTLEDGRELICGTSVKQFVLPNLSLD